LPTGVIIYKLTDAKGNNLEAGKFVVAR
jgi:hypothetical protein